MSLGFASVRQRNFNLIRTLDNVMVGENIAVVADNDTGAKTRTLLRGVVFELVAKKETEPGSLLKG
jgi:hypothetical protein